MEYIILVLALVGIVFSADFLVAGSVSIARRYKVSDFVIGAAIIGVGTSAPELMVSFMGALGGNADVAIGNVVGSNIFNVLGILGITAIFFPVSFDRQNLKFEIPFCIGASAMLMLLAFNFFNGTGQSVGRFDGLILLAIFAVFMWISFARDKKMNPVTQPSEELKQEKIDPMWLAIIKVVGGLTVLVICCDLFVDNAVTIAKKLGLSESFISITLIACGTSLPELAASAAAAFKKNTQLALGNIIGSNIFNITLILGVASQITPLTSSGITAIDYSVVIVSAMLIFILGFMKKINRLAGILMIGSFVAYTLYLLY